MLGPRLTVINSSVTDNSAELEASLPNSVELFANSGGIHIASSVSAATISNTTIAGNSVTMTNTVGDAEAFSGGIDVDLEVDFKMSNSVVADNSVSSATLAGSSAMPATRCRRASRQHQQHAFHRQYRHRQLSGRGRDRHRRRHSSTLRSITHSVISDNNVHASSPGGTAFAAGGAIGSRPASRCGTPR